MEGYKLSCILKMIRGCKIFFKVFLLLLHNIALFAWNNVIILLWYERQTGFNCGGDKLTI